MTTLYPLPKLTTTNNTTYIDFHNKPPAWKDFDINKLIKHQRHIKPTDPADRNDEYLAGSPLNVPRVFKPTKNYTIPKKNTDLSVSTSTYIADFCNNVHNCAAIPNPFSIIDENEPDNQPQSNPTTTTRKIILRRMHVDSKSKEILAAGKYSGPPRPPNQPHHHHHETVSRHPRPGINPHREDFANKSSGQGEVELVDILHMDSEPVWEFRTNTPLITTQKYDYQDRFKYRTPPPDFRLLNPDTLQDILKRRQERNPVRHEPIPTGELTTTNHVNFVIPGFNPKDSDIKMHQEIEKNGLKAGQPTPRNKYTFQYSSDVYAEIMKRQEYKILFVEETWKRKKPFLASLPPRR
ncbi:hypothetical protein HK098_006024 [Nowakowskiella sp. JEL0407]|nr:hypothetical protein HK098_006024 [Nowakowskiella sp. JEL0407]